MRCVNARPGPISWPHLRLLAFRRWAEVRKVRELNINMSVAIEMQRFNKMMGKLGINCSGSNFSLPLEPVKNNLEEK